MRLTEIEARELLSFDLLRLSDLPQTLVVVGPNSGGKTNLLRLLQIVLVAIDQAATFSQEAYGALVRLRNLAGAAPAEISGVRLGITLTEPWERKLLASFVRASIASSLLRDTATNLDASGSTTWPASTSARRFWRPSAAGPSSSTSWIRRPGPGPSAMSSRRTVSGSGGYSTACHHAGPCCARAMPGGWISLATPSPSGSTSTNSACQSSRSRWPICCRQAARAER